eukprot:gene42468-51879_t
MKGFLNKVQNKVVGGKPAGEGKPTAPMGESMPSNAANAAKIDGTPKADISLPKRHDRRRSSLARHNKMQVVKELPLLSETPMLKREALFRQKLQLCCTMFDFEDPDSDVRGKELKRETLVELAEYVNTPA